MNTNPIWQRYEQGRRYNAGLSPSQYELVNTNTEFYAGNQWLHLPETEAMQRLGRPTFNIIKRITAMFVASLSSTATAIRYTPLRDYAGASERWAAMATEEVGHLLEKFHMDWRIREALTDGAVSGDYCAHFYWDAEALPYGGAFGKNRGEIRMELVDGINVMFGDPNSSDVESQPYILLVGRGNAGELRQEAERHRPGSGEGIRGDSEWDGQTALGGKRELGGSGAEKCLYVYMYSKVPVDEPIRDENGTPLTETVTDEQGRKTVRPLTRRVKHVVVSKAARGGVIYENVDTGLSRYPIAWGNWEKQKNQYHGRALVTGVVPNQIYINTTFALAMRHLQLMGFPKTVYNADVIRRWSNEVGMAIGVRGLAPGQRLGDVAYHLQAADMSQQILQTIDRAVAYTKECLGATDAQLGSARPDNTSALLVLQRSSEVPLENIRAGLHQWLEDIGGILLDMMGTYYGTRTVLRERMFTEPVQDERGRPVLDAGSGRLQTRQVRRTVTEEWDFSAFRHLWLNVAVDVGESSYYSEIAMTQTLDNLRRDGLLDAVQYLERVPDKLIPRKGDLIEELKARAKRERQEERQT